MANNKELCIKADKMSKIQAQLHVVSSSYVKSRSIANILKNVLTPVIAVPVQAQAKGRRYHGDLAII